MPKKISSSSADGKPDPKPAHVPNKIGKVPPWPQPDQIDDAPARSAMPLPPGTPQYFRGDPHPTQPGLRFIRWQNGTPIWGDEARWWETKRKAITYREKKCTQGYAFVARILHNAAQQRAKRYKVPFTLTRAQVENLLVAAGEKCPALKIDFCGAGRYTQPSAQLSRSLHRVKPAYGYQLANVRVITWRANRLCALYTNGEEARRIADFLDQSNAEVQAAIDRGELLPPAS